MAVGKITVAKQDVLENSMDEKIIACLSCLAPNEATVDFCERCGAPLGTTATLDPLKMIRAEAFMLEKATVGKPKLIVLLGIWIIFFPMLAASVLLTISQILYGISSEGFVFFWIGFGLTILSLVVLYRVTRNYFTPPDLKQTEDN